MSLTIIQKIKIPIIKNSKIPINISNKVYYKLTTNQMSIIKPSYQLFSNCLLYDLFSFCMCVVIYYCKNVRLKLKLIKEDT